MGQILIRNLDDAIIGELKRRAVQNATSAEEEARRALAANAGRNVDAILKGLDAARAMNGPQHGPDSLQLLRADRARDEVA